MFILHLLLKREVLWPRAPLFIFALYATHRVEVTTFNNGKEVLCVSDLIELIGKILGIAGGLLLIVLVLVWFGFIPMTAFIFDTAFNGWQLLLLLAMMIATIALIVKFIMK